MLFKRAESEFWYVRYRDASGRRVKRSTGTTDRREAEELEAKWRPEAREQRLWGTQPQRTFDELMLRYLKETKGDGQKSELEFLGDCDPFQYVVKVEYQFACAVLTLDNSERMNVVVVPRHLVELLVSPARGGHAFRRLTKCVPQNPQIIPGVAMQCAHEILPCMASTNT